MTRVLAVALVIATSVSVAARVGEAANDGDTRGFLIFGSAEALPFEALETDCPMGWEPTVEELFQATLTPAERERLLRPQNAEEYGRRWKNDFITGPGGENVCNNPKSFLDDPRHPPFWGVQSRVAYGLNLDRTSDGHATPNSCAHQKFEGLDGEPAVDNQFYRALGCGKLRRSGGNPLERYDPYLIELRGLDSLQNDDDVEVGIYSTDDESTRSQTGEHLPHQSFRVTPNPRWRTTTRGRIVDGVLTTDRVEVLYLRWKVSTTGLFGQVSELEFRNARFRVALTPDGTVKGIMAGYRPIDNVGLVHRCCKATASTANYDCASEYKTLVAMADGYPDPETGQCTMISTAHHVVGIPAFIVHSR